MVVQMSRPVEEMAAEARRILDAADQQGLHVRAVGGLAVHLHTHRDLPASLSRSYQDIDFFAAKGHQKSVTTLFEGLGYRSDRHFNAAHGDRRLLFVDSQDRHLDVFVGVFQLCHRIPIEDRLDADELTLPLSELLLTKLQIVELTEKDQRDILTLLHQHAVGPSDDETVNVQIVGRLLAADWGLWRTCTRNIEATRATIDAYELSDADRSMLLDRLEALTARIEAEPKSRKWRARARVGERVRWYDEPEEEPEI